MADEPILNIEHLTLAQSLDAVSENVFQKTMTPSLAPFEEGIILGRNQMQVILPATSTEARVNGPPNNKGQYFWDGTYRVKLRRGQILDNAFDSAIIGLGGQDQRVLCYGEVVNVVWMMREDVRVPVVVGGNTMEFYTKKIEGRAVLMDYGERTIRASISKQPELMADGSTDFPFSDNQFDHPGSAPTAAGGSTYDENPDKIVKLPGAEMFLDKFGRSILVSRHADHEFVTTMGKVDTGQDDVSKLTTTAQQDAYYAQIKNDESQPVNDKEPFAPKPLNLVQYEEVHKKGKIAGDPDATRTINVGLLPRFDKWKFQPIVIRSYETDTNGAEVTEDIFSVHQLRQQTQVNGSYQSGGYCRNITDQGDVKEFVPRHVNQRAVGDCLKSIGGTYDLKVKANYTDDSFMVNVEYKIDGTIRLRSADKFEQIVNPDGSLTLYIGATSAGTPKATIQYAADGSIAIDCDGAVTVNAGGDASVNSEGLATIQGSSGVKLASGDAVPWAPNILPACLFTGVPHGGSGAGVVKLTGA